jgi:hypothetical protein
MEKQQTCGEVTYTDDEPVLPGTLYAAVVYSKVVLLLLLLPLPFVTACAPLGGCR